MPTSVASLLLLLGVLPGWTEKAGMATAVARLGDAPSKFVLYSLNPSNLNLSVEGTTGKAIR